MQNLKISPCLLTLQSIRFIISQPQNVTHSDALPLILRYCGLMWNDVDQTTATPFLQCDYVNLSTTNTASFLNPIFEPQRKKNCIHGVMWTSQTWGKWHRRGESAAAETDVTHKLEQLFKQRDNIASWGSGQCDVPALTIFVYQGRTRYKG